AIAPPQRPSHPGGGPVGEEVEDHEGHREDGPADRQGAEGGGAQPAYEGGVDQRDEGIDGQASQRGDRQAEDRPVVGTAKISPQGSQRFADSADCPKRIFSSSSLSGLSLWRGLAFS